MPTGLCCCLFFEQNRSKIRPSYQYFIIMDVEMWAEIHQIVKIWNFFCYKSAPEKPIPLSDFYKSWQNVHPKPVTKHEKHDKTSVITTGQTLCMLPHRRHILAEQFNRQTIFSYVASVSYYDISHYHGITLINKCRPCRRTHTRWLDKIDQT